MSGLGVGITVGLGVVIGAILAVPNPPPIELVCAFVVYSLLSGGAFEWTRYMFFSKDPHAR